VASGAGGVTGWSSLRIRHRPRSESVDVVSIILAFVAGFSLVLAGWFYYHLWRWAKDCETATVAIAYKRKVVMSPTLVELLLWSRKVPKGQNGQVFYKGPNVTVAIVKPVHTSRERRHRLGQAQSKMGTWAMRQDQNPKEPDKVS
jgi:hypothetical protein